MVKIRPKGICIEQREPTLVLEVTESIGPVPTCYIVLIPWRALGRILKTFLGKLSVQPEEEREGLVPKLRFRIWDVSVEVDWEKIVRLLLKGPVVYLSDVFERDHDTVFVGTFALPAEVSWDERKDNSQEGAE